MRWRTTPKHLDDLPTSSTRSTPASHASVEREYPASTAGAAAEPSAECTWWFKPEK